MRVVDCHDKSHMQLSQTSPCLTGYLPTPCIGFSVKFPCKCFILQRKLGTPLVSKVVGKHAPQATAKKTSHNKRELHISTITFKSTIFNRNKRMQIVRCHCCRSISTAAVIQRIYNAHASPLLARVQIISKLWRYAFKSLDLASQLRCKSSVSGIMSHMMCGFLCLPFKYLLSPRAMSMPRAACTACAYGVSSSMRQALLTLHSPSTTFPTCNPLLVRPASFLLAITAPHPLEEVENVVLEVVDGCPREVRLRGNQPDLARNVPRLGLRLRQSTDTCGAPSAGGGLAGGTAALSKGQSGSDSLLAPRKHTLSRIFMPNSNSLTCLSWGNWLRAVLQIFA